MSAHPSAQAFKIRLYRAADRAAAYQVCLKTGAAGQDATHLYEDPELLGHIYVGPYLALEPEFAFVLEDARGVCGYCLGALDTEVFSVHYLKEWLPPLQARYPKPHGPKSRWTPDERLQYALHHPDPPNPALARSYPSHLHIDLLPRAQGQGQGRRLMNMLLAALTRCGSVGVHLGLARTNLRALHFYEKLGFLMLTSPDLPSDALWMARRLP